MLMILMVYLIHGKNLEAEMYLKNFSQVYAYFYNEPVKRLYPGKGTSLGFDILIEKK